MNWHWRIREVTGNIWLLLRNWLWILFPKWAENSRQMNYEERIVTIEEIEAKYSKRLAEFTEEEINKCPELRKPFGFINEQWEMLKSKMQPGDELVEFCSGAWTWDNLCGRAGVVLRRKGKDICCVLTIIN